MGKRIQNCLSFLIAELGNKFKFWMSRRKRFISLSAFMQACFTESCNSRILG